MIRSRLLLGSLLTVWSFCLSAEAPPRRPLEFHLAEREERQGLLPMRVEGRTGFIYLHPEVVLDDRDVESAAAVQGQHGQPSVQVKLTPGGFTKMKDVMRTNQNRTIAIVAQGKVVSTPVIVGELSDDLLDIEGSFSKEETEALAMALNSKE